MSADLCACCTKNWCKDFCEDHLYGSIGTCEAAAVPVAQLNLLEDSNPYICVYIYNN